MAPNSHLSGFKSLLNFARYGGVYSRSITPMKKSVGSITAGGKTITDKSPKFTWRIDVRSKTHAMILSSLLFITLRWVRSIYTGIEIISDNRSRN